jgi:toxin YoeB
MISVVEPRFRDELRDWISDNKRIALKIMDLVDAVERNPYEGIGKPEPLKHQFAGLWSRRIDQEHRLVYQVAEESVMFLSCKGHYI